MRIPLHPLVLLLAVSLAFTACSDITGSERRNASLVSFTYGGVTSGSFQAEGFPRSGTDPYKQTLAIGQRDPSVGGMAVLARLQRSGGAFDIVTLYIPGSSAGSVQIDWNCDRGQGNLACPAVNLILGFRDASGAQSSYYCYLDAGAIHLASISQTRARGTFSGTGFCKDGAGVRIDGETFTISDGQFDVRFAELL